MMPDCNKTSDDLLIVKSGKGLIGEKENWKENNLRKSEKIYRILRNEMDM
jgi:hypothetical protein